MSKAFEPVLEAGRIRFVLARFEMVDGARLEVEGRWSGVRGRRFMRPALTVSVDGESVRLLADLDHKPWAPDADGPWIAAFPSSFGLEEIAEAELTVAPDVTIRLPLGADDDQTREEPALDLDTALGGEPGPSGEPEPPETRLRRALEVTRRERDDAFKAASRDRIERERAHADRSAAIVERDHAVAKRDAAVEERDQAMAERNEAVASRQQAEAERDTATAERERMRTERDRAVASRQQAESERDSATADRDQLRTERDAAVLARDAAVREREVLLSALRRGELPPGDTGMPAQAARPAFDERATVPRPEVAFEERATVPGSKVPFDERATVAHPEAPFDDPSTVAHPEAPFEERVTVLRRQPSGDERPTLPRRQSPRDERPTLPRSPQSHPGEPARPFGSLPGLLEGPSRDVMVPRVFAVALLIGVVIILLVVLHVL